MGLGCLCDIERDDLLDLLAANGALPVGCHDNLGATEAHAHVLARFRQSVLVEREADDALFLAVFSIVAI